MLEQGKVSLAKSAKPLLCKAFSGKGISDRLANRWSIDPKGCPKSQLKLYS